MSDTKPLNDPVLKENTILEQAIDTWRKEDTKDNLAAVLEAVRTRMHEEGEFAVPIAITEDGARFMFRKLQSKDGRIWIAACTSRQELEKGPESNVIPYMIDDMLKVCIDREKAGLILNPYGQPFMLAQEWIEMIFKADGGKGYIVPDDTITPELLEGGSFLKRAIEIYSRNRTPRNLLKLLRILRGSYVWIPCTAVLGDADRAELEKPVKEAEESGGAETLVGRTLSNRENIRLVPDILKGGEDFYFPVFTSAEDMGEYGKNFSKVEKHFLEAISLAQNDKRNVTGIVINAFAEPFIVPRELFDLIERIHNSNPHEATNEYHV